ncbi:hypothetical protein KUV85_02930 [Nocardioides panacisoli]|uniref:hypothetical protein n=1 Tax=Nocardioides panacisoli TaxID=627624 RepID=UPI001C6394D7|nr:hypothetical protein [Nocardioides panacisoli]QYJ04650.1 hypothetical protein KUV85_02930 [Nocardioides panacisoli]
MTVDQTTGHRRTAATARSILSCPADVQLVVDGIEDISDGIEPDHPGAVPVLRMQDVDGRPGFSCPATAALALAAHEGRSALLTVASGLGAPGSPDRGEVLTIAGPLRADLEECACCSEVRTLVTVHAEMVVLDREDRPESRRRVPLAAFNAPDLHLNRGFLQRSMEHANECHQEELRHAVATSAAVPAGRIAGVGLSGLAPDRVEVHWVDHSGAHRRELRFPRTATTTTELGELLREELHAGLC